MASFRPPPLGYGFHPTDEELVDYYLRLKMLGRCDEEVGIIAEVNVCNYEPWELRGLSAIQSNDPECYFFCPRNYKYANRQRAKRTTKAGYWKVTGKDRMIRGKHSGEQIATKKTLVYYMGRPRGDRTNWIMHEYNPTFNFNNQRYFVLCKLKIDPDYDEPAFEEGESSSRFDNQLDESGYGPLITSNSTNSMAEEESAQIQAQLDSFHGYDERDYNMSSALQFNYGNMP